MSRPPHEILRAASEDLAKLADRWALQKDHEADMDGALYDLHLALSDREKVSEEYNALLEDLGDMRRGLLTPEEVYAKWLDLTLI